MTNLNPPHDPHDPMSQPNMLEASLLAVNLPPCPHCNVDHNPIPMSGTGWDVDSVHEDGCPTNDLPAPQRPGSDRH